MCARGHQPAHHGRRVEVRGQLIGADSLLTSTDLCNKCFQLRSHLASPEKCFLPFFCFFFFFFLHLVCVCMCVCMCVCDGMCIVCRSEENCGVSVLSFHLVGSRDWTQGARLHGKHLLPDEPSSQPGKDYLFLKVCMHSMVLNYVRNSWGEKTFFFQWLLCPFFCEFKVAKAPTLKEPTIKWVRQHHRYNLEYWWSHLLLLRYFLSLCTRPRGKPPRCLGGVNP